MSLIAVCVFIYIYIHTVVVRIIGTLGKYDQRRLWKLICMLILLIFYLKNSQKYNLSLENKNLKWEEYHY